MTNKQEIIDDHFEFLQELVKALKIKKEMPPNLDEWHKIILEEITNNVSRSD